MNILFIYEVINKITKKVRIILCKMYFFLIQFISKFVQQTN